MGEVPGNIGIHGKPVFESISSKVYVQYMQLFMTETLKSIGSIAFLSIVYILFNLVDTSRENHILLCRERFMWVSSKMIRT